MTSYPASIDLTEGSANGEKFNMVVGSGGVTAGYAVKYDGSNPGTVVACTAASDVAVGIARDTVAAAGSVCVLGNGCLIQTAQTISYGRVGITSGGVPCTYSSGTYIGLCDTSATTASIVRIRIQY